VNERFFRQPPFALDDLPESLEEEQNDDAKSAQRLKLPQIVNGRIDRPGDIDVFRVAGRAGHELVAEVLARRLNSTLDSVLRLTDEKGREIAVNDDHEDPGAGLTTHHADSRLRVKLPRTGYYFVHLRDAQRQGGENCAYRLRISAPQPDFELRVVPSSINAAAGSSVPVTVHALRRDGFDGEIAISLRHPPPGVSLSGGSVPPDENQLRLTLAAPPDPLDSPVRLTIEGRAEIDGQEVRHVAVAAEDMMQAFLNRHLVPAESLMVAVTERKRARFEIEVLDEMPVKLPAGGTAEISFSWPRKPPDNLLHFQLSQPPEGIAIQDVTFGRRFATITLWADEEKVERGQRGNLIVEVLRKANGKPGKGKASSRRRALGILPAISFEIVRS
jgi:hypothetical protein